MSPSELIDRIFKSVEALDDLVVDLSCESDGEEPVLTRQQVRILAGIERTLKQLGSLYGPQ